MSGASKARGAANERRMKRGAERRGGSLELTRIAGLAAAGHNVGNPSDDVPADDDYQMFPDDIETGIERPDSGMWSCGPKGMGN